MAKANERWCMSMRVSQNPHRALLGAALLSTSLLLGLASSVSAQEGDEAARDEEKPGQEADPGAILDQTQELIRKADRKASADAEEQAADKAEGKPDKPVVRPQGPIPKEMWGQGKGQGGEEVKRENVVVGDPEYGPIEPGVAPTAKNPLTMEFSLRSEVHTFENVDMLALVEDTDQDIINTDDRSTFAYSGIYARLNYEVMSDLQVNVALAHNGLWAEDQLGSDAQLVGALAFTELSFVYTPVESEAFRLSFKVGRQPFAIGGVPRDYMLDDLLDAVVVEADAGKAGRLRLLGLDFYAANDLPNASFVRYVGGREPVLGLRGDTYTLRTGAIYENDNAAVPGLVAKAYAFYADIGGGPISESGADVSYGGSLGNFSDNDWAAMFGGRVAYDLKLGESASVLLFGEASHSEGIDRKEVVARDVSISGNAFGGGAVLNLTVPETLSARLGGDFYLFQGGQYGEDGLEYERGFVGFKGRQIGGLNLDRYAGWHPSAYVGSGGVDSQPQDLERIAGTQAIHVLASATILERATLQVDWWLLMDTQTSNLDFDDLDNIDPPFGYSRQEYAAQERFGQALGQEIDVQLSYRFNKALTGYAAGGFFLPGEYYKVRVDRVVGTALGGDVATFWAATAGAEVRF